MSSTLKTASVLAFERKLDPSDAVFHAGNWDDRAASASWPSVKLREKSVRGTISNRLKTKDQDPAKLDAAIENPNLQTVDVAALPADADTLKVQFTLRVLSGAGTPSACNSAEYQARLAQTVQTYASAQGFAELANRYAANLANGRFLWRNRVGAESVQVQVVQLKDGKAGQAWSFDALAHNLRTLEQPDEKVAALGSVIADGLEGKAHVLLQITAFVRLGAGQEVFPSQELILDKGSTKRARRSTRSGKRPGGRRHPLPENRQRPAHHRHLVRRRAGPGPYRGRALRLRHHPGQGLAPAKQKQDFYTLLDDWLLKDKVPPVEQQHFVMAVLIRGGVFGDAS